MSQPLRFEEVTIASGAAVSSAVECDAHRVVGVITPAAWTAADISFEVSVVDGTWVKAVNRAGALYKITGVATGAAEYNLICGDANQGDIVIAGPRLRLASTNTGSEANVNQDAARTLYLVLAPF